MIFYNDKCLADTLEYLKKNDNMIIGADKEMLYYLIGTVSMGRGKQEHFFNVRFPHKFF